MRHCEVEHAGNTWGKDDGPYSTDRSWKQPWVRHANKSLIRGLLRWQGGCDTTTWSVCTCWPCASACSCTAVTVPCVCRQGRTSHSEKNFKPSKISAAVIFVFWLEIITTSSREIWHLYWAIGLQCSLWKINNSSYPSFFFFFPADGLMIVTTVFLTNSPHFSPQLQEDPENPCYQQFKSG